MFLSKLKEIKLTTAFKDLYSKNSQNPTYSLNAPALFATFRFSIKQRIRKQSVGPEYTLPVLLAADVLQMVQVTPLPGKQ